MYDVALKIVFLKSLTKWLLGHLHEISNPVISINTKMMANLSENFKEGFYKKIFNLWTIVLAKVFRFRNLSLPSCGREFEFNLKSGKLRTNWIEKMIKPRIRFPLQFWFISSTGKVLYLYLPRCCYFFYHKILKSSFPFQTFPQISFQFSSLDVTNLKSTLNASILWFHNLGKFLPNKVTKLRKFDLFTPRQGDGCKMRRLKRERVRCEWLGALEQTA